MFFCKNKTFFSLTISTILLFAFNAIFIFSPNHILTDDKTNSLKKVAVQGASAIHAEITGGMNVLNALSNQKFFFSKTGKEDIVRVLAGTAKKQQFRCGIYADASGFGLSDTGGQIPVVNKLYFINAMKGVSGISAQQEIPQSPGEAIFTMPVLQNHAAAGVLAPYSAIKGTDGWIFPAAEDLSHFFALTDRILFSGLALFISLTIAFFTVLFYFFKLKKLSDESKIREDEQKRYFTYYDALTNLPNRKGVVKQFDCWIEKCRKGCLSGGALFVDIDHLKSVNNTFGYDAGDKLLCESAARLKRAVGSQNIISRIGSDEFFVLVHGINTEESLQALAKKIIRIFREPYLINGIVIQLSCSVGAMMFPFQGKEQRAQQFEDILRRGEFVLNKAKQTRRGSYLLFNENYSNLIDRQLQLERSLKFCIERNELICYFQPQFDCRTQTIMGFETLARWKSEEFGMISPVQFIPMAEKSGFIKEIGHSVIDSAFSFAKSMQDRGVVVSFNASPVELLEANYADYVISRFQYYGLKANSVAVEVTESSLISSFEKVTKKLQMLKRHGILIYLDDFGTGFSSLTSLKNLPINAVKIDKSFIDEIVTKEVEKDIVHMIIMLADRLNLEVIAEGVETADQIRCVSQAGCHLVQGYFISRPVPEEEIPPLFADIEKQKCAGTGENAGAEGLELPSQTQ